MIIYIPVFDSPEHPFEILGAFTTKEQAEEIISSEIAIDKSINAKYTARHQQNRFYYSIIEKDLDNEI